MSLNRPPHACTSCRLCEAISLDTYRRHWKVEDKARAWHVIADGPHLMGRLPRQAHFATILAYRPDPDGTPGWYRGPLYWEFDASNVAHALEDLRQTLELLRV